MMLEVHMLQNVKCDVCQVYLFDFPRSCKDVAYAMIDKQWARFGNGSNTDKYICRRCTEVAQSLEAAGLYLRSATLVQNPDDDREVEPF